MRMNLGAIPLAERPAAGERSDPSMFLKQFFVEGLAHASYMIGSEGAAAIIDPRRDVDIYIDEARAQGLKITHVLETHLHADFLSGHLELSHLVGAKIYAPRGAGVQYEHVPLAEGDVIQIGAIRMRAIETPGHTPEHISLVVADLSRAEAPCLVFTGDTLFVGSVGRPDLFGEDRVGQLSDKLFDSLHGKLGVLPDFVEVYPAHGEGSLCGRNLSAKRCSTIGYEKRFNPAFEPSHKEAFRTEILRDMPTAPRYFFRTSDANRRGPRVIGQVPQLREVPVAEAKELIDKGCLVVDTRTPEAFGGAHIPASYSIWFGPALSTWSGWVLPCDRPILLLLEDPEQGKEAMRWLLRVGFDDVEGHIGGGVEAWMEAGFPIGTLPQLSVHRLAELIARQKEIIVTDVRTPAEYNEGHITGALNIHAGQMAERSGELNREDPIAVVCRTAHRSSVAGSILKRQGFESVYNVSGGMTAWTNAGHEVEKSNTETPEVTLRVS
jgi:glyoxylase-like metal-dependent hydrolase (beta-lactamase superfamily II)/rhodanese-related sulfurtransferase